MNESTLDESDYLDVSLQNIKEIGKIIFRVMTGADWHDCNANYQKLENLN